MQPVGLLAESWEWNDDNTAVTFNLRRGVKFHDGSDFDAADVKHSLENAANPEIGLTVHTLLRDLDHVEIVDDHTVVVHLKQPNNSFLAIIMDEAWIVPEGMLPEELKTNPIGTGPFMFEAWDRGQEDPAHEVRRLLGRGPAVPRRRGDSSSFPTSTCASPSTARETWT